MDNNLILKATIQVFRECKVQSFPINCIDILKHYGYRIFTYTELKKKNTELYKMCIEYSDDAFRVGSNKMIAYNDEKPVHRICFSLMHELGHHVLNHSGDSRSNEQQANLFASYLLAPRMAIHYSNCKDANDVSHVFDISHEAAENAFEDYRRWHRHVIIYKMSQYDKALYSHFYNETKKCFIWNIKKCDFCGTILYNSFESHCKFCTLPPAHTSHEVLLDKRDPWDDNVKILHAQHLKWLYDV